MNTKPKKLSARTELLLWIVYSATDRDWSTGELHRFFYPHAKPYFYRDGSKMRHTYIGGSGDASAFKGLERRGLIERPRTSLGGEYIYALTEDGLMYVREHQLDERFE